MNEGVMNKLFCCIVFIALFSLFSCSNANDEEERIESFEQYGLDADEFPDYESGDEVVAEYCYYNPHECD